MQNNIEVDETIAQSKESNMACSYPYVFNKTVSNNIREPDPFS